MNKTFDLDFLKKLPSSSASTREDKIALLKQMTAAAGELKLRFDKFLNPNDIKNTYRPMQKDSTGPQQIAPAQEKSKADNEDGMMNNPTPLSKDGGSNTYSGADTSGQQTGDSMPKVKDDGYTATSDDDSAQDYIEWVEPLQCEIECLAGMIADLWFSLNNQQNCFWDYVCKHGEGHIPPVQSTSQMVEVLKTLGLNKDYVVQPQTIYASNGSVKEINLKLTPKK